jgi:hypothetical protein
MFFIPSRDKPVGTSTFEPPINAESRPIFRRDNKTVTDEEALGAGRPLTMTEKGRKANERDELERIWSP